MGMSRWHVAAITLSVALCMCTIAIEPLAAQAAPVASLQPSAADDSGWYGWQTLSVDAAGLLTGVIAANSLDLSPGKLGVTAATWYGIGAVAAPAVHHAHGRWYIGLADFGLRAFAPPLIGFFGLLSTCGVS